MGPPAANSACQLLIEPGSTKTTGPRCPTSTPGGENAKCVVSSRQRRCSVLSRSMLPPTTHSVSQAIVSRRSTIDSFGSKPSPLGRPRRAYSERTPAHRGADNNRFGENNLTIPTGPHKPPADGIFQGPSDSRRRRWPALPPANQSSIHPETLPRICRPCRASVEQRRRSPGPGRLRW